MPDEDLRAVWLLLLLELVLPFCCEGFFAVICFLEFAFVVLVDLRLLPDSFVLI
ncbi:hypothetical protein LPW11_18275 [Geomonas sp. RF6]|uniref:hypothetical protein n=1 Tax=Geomonas sp. RF6 TaxID=2897342 RepID=UPI001E431F98|nr:hypothetical protein [Geomonas sp. RF6]UFS69823.1 hypothetical protein LPW11_18275 [Geomonas sp. RF6]